MADFGDLYAYKLNICMPMEKEIEYVSPKIDILFVEVEKGFASSGSGSESWVEGGHGSI